MYLFGCRTQSLIEEDQIELTSVGVDIGSSTSHLLFSTIMLERLDTRYVVTGPRGAVCLGHPADALCERTTPSTPRRLGGVHRRGNTRRRG